MKLFSSRFVFALSVSVIFAGASEKLCTRAAQDGPEIAHESVLSQPVTANDEIAAQDVAAHQVHLRPVRSRQAAHGRFQDANMSSAEVERNSGAPSPEAGVAGFSATSVPGVTSPGYYPADLSNPNRGKVLTSVQSNNVYVNCAASCWGSPANFLGRLATSNFIHITDEYAGGTANNRYTLGAATSISATLPGTLNSSNILQFVHAAARAHGSGYDHIYHVFLRAGVNVCTSTNVCYSPGNSSTFVFCAYHGSVDFKDIGHVLYSVEPYQNVAGCSVAQPSPNGPVVDSTSSTLSHELIEAITDPDGDAWYARNSLVEYGAEIGDICENPFGKYGAFEISGKWYAIQPEYSNKFHACSTLP